MTSAAGLAIKTLTDRNGAPADGGLRIETLSPEQDTSRFTLSVAAAPDELDLVVRETATGARVLLDSLTAEYLSDFVLDVDDTVEGTAQFRLKPDS
ncbi:hypothetical protein [Kibdelosporangium phytohabitans]|uniref:hypothetical protein n=1 Tax=Kibdelosporangium phytohabitans TaxID=860235 RepID=UPI0012F8A3B9|nr:hypothetical protein [Kibdelosporangium phytohabitans]MBE1469454.1 Fe-S cluster assembly iron-binding protein IscA [Kibdelosporangium phytohabitans]